MRWILFFFFVLFLILRAKLEAPYEKSHSAGLWSESFKPRFINYLEKIKEETQSRVNPFLMSWREPPNEYFHPDAPANWQPALISRRERLIHLLSLGSFFLYVAILIDAVRGAYIHRPWGDIPVGDILLLVAVLPPLFWMRKRAYVDGLTQGYLDGYADAYQKAYTDAKIEDGKIQVSQE